MHIHLPYPLPYHAQIATPELATAIFVEGMDPRLDPNWRESGAQTPGEYAFWVERACGVACVKMVVEALGGARRSLVEWARRGVEIGGYLVEEGENGERREIGWVHRSLAELMRAEGLEAQPLPATPTQILEHLLAGRLVLASVSYEVGDGIPVTKKGGHLVVVRGAEYEGEQLLAFFINNPSGRRGELQANARIPAERFELGYTGRIITVEKSASNP